MKRLLVLVFLSSSLIAGWSYWKIQNWLQAPLSITPKNRFLEITQQDNLSSVIKRLSDLDLIDSPKLLYYWARWHRLGAQLKRGEYAIDSQMTPLELFALLKTGKSLGRLLTIPEGYNIFEIADLFAKEQIMNRTDFLQWVRSAENIQNLLAPQGFKEYPHSLEGYLFPETYHITKHTKGPPLITQMVQTFFKRLEPLQEQVQLSQWPIHKITTLASIIEKETGAPWERPLISAVFHNRLKLGMKLQTDPTIIYGKALQTDLYVIKITRGDLTWDHPYSTYARYGLPPGPIANPGFKSLEAALNPDPNSKALFFVSRNDGTHIFSENLGQHNQAVQKFQKDPKAREGKSWRDLNPSKN